MPAARLALSESWRAGGGQPSTQPHELLTTSGAFDGSAPVPSTFVGAMNHCMHSRYVGTTPRPWLMFRHAIHLASGAMPISFFCVPRGGPDPTIVPTVCVP